MIRKLEWLEDYKQLNPDPIPRNDGSESAGNEIFEYKKGQVITVEVMGDDNFRDLSKNINFHVFDRSQFRLLPVPLVKIYLHYKLMGLSLVAYSSNGTFEVISCIRWIHRSKGKCAYVLELLSINYRKIRQ